MRTKAGLSLVELLLTLAVAALAAGALALTAPPAPTPLERTAEDLTRSLARAGRDAVITGEPIALSVTHEGYAFWRRRRGVWRLIDEPKLYPNGPWPETLAVDVGERGERRGRTRGERGDADAFDPAILFDPTGVLSPFEVTLRGEGRVLRIRGAADGSLTVEEEGKT